MAFNFPPLKTHEARSPIPTLTGIGLRSQHVTHFLNQPPIIGWLEIHSENFLSEGGPRRQALEQIREDFPISCHSVGLSLGSAEGVDLAHVARLQRLYDQIAPVLISDHLSWSVAEGTYLNDLLPLPYTVEALDVVCRNVTQVQDLLGRQLLIENPSVYMSFTASTIPEWEFIADLVDRTGCALLLDINNIYVSATNLGFDARDYIDTIATAPIREIHIAGHTRREIEGSTVLIDDHGSPVATAVWRLYEYTLAQIGPCPTLIEWDTDLPPLAALIREAHKADAHLAANQPAEHLHPAGTASIAV